MTEKRIEKVLQKIEYVKRNPKEFKNPEMILNGLYTLLTNF